MNPWPPYLFKADRAGATDYLCEFDHEDLERARHSILWYGQWERQTEQVVGVIEKLGLLAEGARVLDYGCGVGRVTAALLARHRLEVRAADRSPAMRRHAEVHLAEAVAAGRATVCSDVEVLAASPAPLFDLVLLVETMQHIPEPILDTLLPALGRLTAPGGRLFIYGNEHLDVDAEGRLGVTPVADVAARHLTVLRSDFWAFRPRERRSLVAAPRE